MSSAEEARRRFDAKTKPRGSLGRLEELGVRIAGIRGFVPERLEAVVVVAAGDHGVAAEGVSAYPQEVTAQMVANFAAGGAAVSVLARQAGARLVVVDAGTATACTDTSVRAPPASSSQTSSTGSTSSHSARWESAIRRPRPR